MKTLKFAAFAIALGFFAASCGGETKTETVDSTTIVTETPAEVAPVEPTAPMTPDTTAATTTTTTTTDTTVKK